MTPRNQHELVLHTLIYPPQELTIGYWMNVYKSHKWSSRLGEVEKMLNITLVERESKTFVNRFGHTSTYTVYKPVLDKKEYIELFKKIQNDTKKETKTPDANNDKAGKKEAQDDAGIHCGEGRGKPSDIRPIRDREAQLGIPFPY